MQSRVTISASCSSVQFSVPAGRTGRTINHDRQLANSDLQYLEIGNFIDHRRRWMVVSGVVMVVTVRLLHALYSQPAPINR
jgi:hypothetical protein